MKGDIMIIGERRPKTNRFYKDVEQLTKASEKMVDKYDEFLEALFRGEMIKYTIVFNKVKRSQYGTDCSVWKKNLNT